MDSLLFETNHSIYEILCFVDSDTLCKYIISKPCQQMNNDNI